jgi:hypothetical protein
MGYQTRPTFHAQILKMKHLLIEVSERMESLKAACDRTNDPDYLELGNTVSLALSDITDAQITIANAAKQERKARTK